MNLTGIRKEVRKEIIKLISTFPETFGLRAFPGGIFRISHRASHFYNGEIILYTESQREGWWALHTRGTEKELREQVVPFKLPENLDNDQKRTAEVARRKVRSRTGRNQLR